MTWQRYKLNRRRGNSPWIVPAANYLIFNVLTIEVANNSATSLLSIL